MGVGYHLNCRRSPCRALPFLDLAERGGKVRSCHIEGSTVGQVIPIVTANVAAVMTDKAQFPGSTGLAIFAGQDRVDHSEGEYVRYEQGRLLALVETSIQ